MKKLLTKALKYATSKKLLWVVVMGFGLYTALLIYLVTKQIDISQLEFSYGWVAKGFIFELILYSGKATIEKTQLVNTTIETIGKSIGLDINTTNKPSLMEDVAHDMNGKK